MTQDPLRINLSLVSHTNIGKTTLARTLLARDIGEIADRAHVTESTDDYVLARNGEGAELVLWDTPGFGNSVQLAKRLTGRSNPVGWFLSEVWDRMANKVQWLNQKALTHVKETSDVVLYLVNAAELPNEAPYVNAEMQILSWIGKPVVVLLNQMGAPRTPEEEEREIREWQDAMSKCDIVSSTIAMDAFARCWVQEFTLFDAIGKALPEERCDVFEALRDTWSRQRRAAYSSSIQALTFYLDKLINDREATEPPSVMEQIRSIGQQFTKFGSKLGIMKSEEDHREDCAQAAQTAMKARQSDAMCELTDKLIAINGLKGRGVRSSEIISRVRSDWDINQPADPLKGAVAGAIGTGAAGGLAADIAAGGLSLGLGTLIGTVVGALGGAGAVITYNQHKDKDGTYVTWSDSAIRARFVEAVLLYLAIAHFGRGRGNWVEGEYPPFWKTTVAEIFAKDKSETKHLPIAFDPIVRRVLTTLYPRAEF